MTRRKDGPRLHSAARDFWAAATMLTLAACGGDSSAPPAPTASTSAPTPAPAPSPTPAPAPAQATGAETPFGYFALTSRRLSDAEKTALVGHPAISGMTSYVTWADIEPTRDQMDFSRLDADIAIARAAGKKITIGVFTGREALPGWLASAGVRLWTTGQGTTLIHPADTVFVALWEQRVALLGQRYDNDPTVVQVTICGAAGTLCGPRYPELPGDVSYDQLVGNWSRVIDAYIAAFPNTHLNLEVHLTAGYGTQLPVDLYARIPAAVAIGPFAEFLSDTNPAPTSPLGQAYAAIASARTYCAFQMVSPLGDRVDEAVALGRGYGCRYFEIYADDVTNHAASLPVP
jgi:hypothetical protein